jgi:nicotinamidase-related amidase
MAHASRMSSGDTALLIIDVQEKLLPLIPDAARLLLNVSFLIDGARLLGLPVLATEQYPRGLGPTNPEVARRLPGPVPEKLAFSSCGAPSIVESLHREARPKVVLAGMETHVCVLQSALDLLALDFRVYVVLDAVAARYRTDHDAALRRLELAGAVPVTAEMCVFEWLGGSDHPRFKEGSRLVQERMKQLKTIA